MTKALTLAVTLLAPTAWAQEAEREAAMFGSEAPEPTKPSRPEADREAALFGGDAPPAPPSRDDAILGGPTRPGPVMDAFADKLAVGGRLYLRNDLYFNEETDLADQSFQMPNLLDVYLDARPTERVRAYARFRLTYNPVAGGDNASPFFPAAEQQWQVGQLWVKWDWARVAFFTVGAQPIRWGTGRIWNPTDVINRQRFDPLAPLDLRLGRPLAKVQFPLEVIGGQLELVADLDDAQRLGEVGAAARLQAVAGPTEWSLSARYKHNQPLLLGLDLSAGLGPFDLYAEAALLRGGHPRRWTGAYRLPSDAQIDAGPVEALAALQVPTAQDRDDDWIPQVVVGAEWPIQYSDQDSLTLGVEYLYNDAGYDDASLYPWLLTNGAFDALYLGRHAVGLFALLMGPGSWNDTTFVLTALTNLSDKTGVARLNVSHRVHRHLTLEPYVAVPFGEAGGAFRLTYEITAKQAAWIAQNSGTRLPFEGGLKVPAQAAQVGLWLRVDL